MYYLFTYWMHNIQMFFQDQTLNIVITHLIGTREMPSGKSARTEDLWCREAEQGEIVKVWVKSLRGREGITTGVILLGLPLGPWSVGHFIYLLVIAIELISRIPMFNRVFFKIGSTWSSLLIITNNPTHDFFFLKHPHVI